MMQIHSHVLYNPNLNAILIQYEVESKQVIVYEKKN